jgi:hypothetical protein
MSMRRTRWPKPWSRKPWPGFWLAGALAFAPLGADAQSVTPLPAQQGYVPQTGGVTLQQHNTANAENRRYGETTNRLRNLGLEQRQDRQRDLLGCQGAGSAAAAAACGRNVEIENRTETYRLQNEAIQQRDQHRETLQQIGVPPLAP